MSFVERYGLWSSEQKEAASRLRKIVEEQKLEVIRLSFPDQHGIMLIDPETLAIHYRCLGRGKQTAHRGVDRSR